MQPRTAKRWPLWLMAPVALVVAAAAAVGLLGLYVAVVWLRLPEVSAADLAVAETAFMRADRAAGRCDGFARVPLAAAAASPTLACAVIWAEDRRFFWHDGFDGTAFAAAVRADLVAGSARLGGSTLAMQLARNLYLSADRTPTRKLKEILLARRLIDHLGREAVVTAYLDAAEWAPCVYGAEAAAQHYFGHPAAALDPAEATLLAALLPRPSRAPGSAPGDRAALMRRQQILLGLLFRARVLDRAGLTASRREVAAMWQGGAPHAVEATGIAVASDALARACGTTASGMLPVIEDMP